MTDQNTHMQELIAKQTTIMEELKKLQAEMMSKQEAYLKLQGAVEYLLEQGVVIPDNP